MLRAQSPLFHAARVRAPLLVMHGDRDPVVPLLHSRRMVEAVRRHGGRVIYVVYRGSRHALRRPGNIADYHEHLEQFLHRHLGGRADTRHKRGHNTAVLR